MLAEQDDHRKALARGLRDLAQLIETEPDVLVPPNIHIYDEWFDVEHDAIVAHAVALDTVETSPKSLGERLSSVLWEHGPVKYEVLAWPKEGQK